MRKIKIYKYAVFIKLIVNFLQIINNACFSDLHVQDSQIPSFPDLGKKLLLQPAIGDVCGEDAFDVVDEGAGGF